MDQEPIVIHSDDADLPDHRRAKLMLFRGGNGDLYLGTCNLTARFPQFAIRVSTSGGRLHSQNRSAYYSIVSLFRAMEDPRPYRTDLLAKLDNLGACIRRLLAGQDTTQGKYKDAAGLLADYGLFGDPLRGSTPPPVCTVGQDLKAHLNATTLHPLIYKAGRVLSFVYGGVHNIPKSQRRALQSANGTDYEPMLVEIMVRDDLASFDFDRLTRLVFAAHEASVRVEVSPANNKAIRVRFHNRNEHDTKLSRFHPRISPVIDTLHARFPRPTWELPEEEDTYE